MEWLFRYVLNQGQGDEPLHPALPRRWICAVSQEEGITLGEAASLSQGQCLKEDTAVSHQHPDSTQQGHLGSAWQHRIGHP